MTVRGHIGNQTLGFILSNIAREERLPVQVGGVNNVVVEDLQSAAPLATNSFRHFTVESPGSYEQSGGGAELGLIEVRDQFLAVRDRKPTVSWAKPFCFNYFHINERHVLR